MCDWFHTEEYAAYFKRPFPNFWSYPLADLAGLHTIYISKLERGLRNPSLATLEQLAGGLDTTMTSVVREVEH